MNKTDAIILGCSAIAVLAFNTWLYISYRRLKKRCIPPEKQEEFILYGYKLAVKNVLERSLHFGEIDNQTAVNILQRVNQFPIVDESNFMFLFKPGLQQITTIPFLKYWCNGCYKEFHSTDTKRYPEKEGHLHCPHCESIEVVKFPIHR